MRAFAVVCLLALGACAPGVDGLRQTCANTDTVLTGGYQLATAGMRDAVAAGRATQLLGCFVDLVAALDVAAKSKAGACEPGAPSSSITSDTAAVASAGAAVAAAVATWRACNVSRS